MIKDLLLTLCGIGGVLRRNREFGWEKERIGGVLGAMWGGWFWDDCTMSGAVCRELLVGWVIVGKSRFTDLPIVAQPISARKLIVLAYDFLSGACRHWFPHQKGFYEFLDAFQRGAVRSALLCPRSSRMKGIPP
jgi:hypothetical protein